jgi:hypothetical protein
MLVMNRTCKGMEIMSNYWLSIYGSTSEWETIEEMLNEEAQENAAVIVEEDVFTEEKQS